MKLSIGIVGLPNVGKSTLFSILTKHPVNIANYPFCTIDPNVGVVPVPDERLEKLAEFSKSAKKIPAIVEFYDIAGLVRGANQGEGLGNQFLSHIREVKAIVEVLRVFPDDGIVHVEESVNPVRDLEIVNAELILKDLETVTKRIEKAEKEAKSGDKHMLKNFETLKRAEMALREGKRIREFASEPIIRELQLLAAKPHVYLVNGRPEDVSEDLKKNIAAMDAKYLVVDLAHTSDVPELITVAYRILNLISFFTTGEDETRAWTIEKGSKAPQAAGAIHSDFEKAFIRAEVVDWRKLLETGGWAEARQKGHIRIEGKEYVVQDGDVLVIRHG